MLWKRGSKIFYKMEDFFGWNGCFYKIWQTEDGQGLDVQTGERIDGDMGWGEWLMC